MGGCTIVLVVMMMTTAKTNILPFPMIAFGQTMSNAQSAAQKPGTINLVQEARDFLNNNLNATLIEAMTAAEASIPYSISVGGHFSVVGGILVYNVTAVHIEDNIGYNVLVDPANGRVLSITSAPQTSRLGLPIGFANATTLLIDAAGMAEEQVPNRMTIAASIEGTQGTAGVAGPTVYDITVADIANGTLHKIKIDPATGKAVSSPDVVPLDQIRIEDLF
jgi:uncharacterized membrane protein YkoI